MSLDRCVQMQNNPSSQNVPLWPFSKSSLSWTISKDNHCSDFYHHSLVNPVLELLINGIIQYVFFCVWLLLLRIFLRFIHLVAYINSELLCEYTTICSHLLIDRHLCYFQFWATMNKAAVNTLIQIFLWIYDFSSLALKLELSGCRLCVCFIL